MSLTVKHSPLFIHEITPKCWILCIFIYDMKINSMHMDFSITKLSSRPKRDNNCPDSVSSLLWRSHWNISSILWNIETLIWICLEKIESEKTAKNCFNRSSSCIGAHKIVWEYSMVYCCLPYTCVKHYAPLRYSDRL